MLDRASRDRVDVIVAYYDRPDLVRAAVVSALEQEGVDTRVIVVDDASLTPPPLDDLLGGRVTVIRRAESGGPGAAHNTGLAAVTADFVSFLDDDDLYPAYRSAELLRLLHTQDADIAYGGQVVFNDGVSPELSLSAAEIASLPRVKPGIVPGTVLLRARTALAMGPLREDSLIGTFVTWIAAARESAHPFREAACDVPVLLHRAHRSNLTRRVFAGPDVLAAVRAHRARTSGP